MTECIVCGDETSNLVKLKSGVTLPICNGEGGCLIPTGEVKAYERKDKLEREGYRTVKIAECHIRR